MTEQDGQDTQLDVPASKLVAVRLPDDLRKRIEAHRALLREQTGLDLSLSMVIKSLVERGLASFEAEAQPHQRKR